MSRLSLSLVAASTLLLASCAEEAITSPETRVMDAPPLAAQLLFPSSELGIPAFDYTVLDLTPDADSYHYLFSEAGYAVFLRSRDINYVLWFDGTETILESPGATGQIAPTRVGDDGTVIGWAYRIATGSTEPAMWVDGAVTYLENHDDPDRPLLPQFFAGEGRIIGLANYPDPYGVVWEDGVLVDRIDPPAGYAGSRPVDANPSGQVLVELRTASGARDVAIWEDGVYEILPATAPVMNPMDMNDAGQAVGAGLPLPPGTSAMPWYFDGGTMSQAPAGIQGGLVSINGAAVATGTRREGPAAVPFRYGPGTYESIATGAAHSEALAINQAGVVVGASRSGAGARPFAFVAEGGAGRLLPLPIEFADASLALGIAENGTAAGNVFAEDGTSRAVIWMPATAEEIRDNLEAGILALGEDGGLSRGLANALVRHLEAGRIGPFIRQVEGLMRGGRMEAGYGRALLDAAEKLL